MMEGAGTASAVASSPFAELPPEDVIFGRSEAMRQLRTMLQRVAATNIPVLVAGENGAGKEVISKLVHLNSPWRNGPFVKVSCAAIPGTLLESELFGYEKGAFTGAYSTKPGRVEIANDGTLLLDEIAELDVDLQAKLLQLLQDCVFCRIGGQEQRQARVRVICTTSRQLQHEMRDGRFRQDLFHRISGVSLRVPPLRERGEDIPVIADYLLKNFNDMFGTQARPLSAKLHRRLQQHRWPGNIRELENVIRRYAILGTGHAISEQVEVRPSTGVYFELPATGTLSLKRITQRAVRELEASVILNVLQANDWNRKRAAEVLEISYRALLYKIRDAGISVAHRSCSRKPNGQAALDGAECGSSPGIEAI